MSTFTTNQILTAKWMNTYVRDNLVLKCLSNDRPARPIYGMEIYETDTKTFRFWDGSAWSVIAQIETIGANWTPVYSGFSIISGVSTVRGFSSTINKSIGLFDFYILNPSISSTVTFSLPADFATKVQPNYGYCGHGYYYDASTGDQYPLICYISGGVVNLYTGNAQTYSALSNTVPVTTSTDDSFAFTCIVELL